MIIQYNGLITYNRGLELQQQSYDSVERSGRPVLLGCEHYPVITLGRRAEMAEELVGSRQELKERGLEIALTDRGGQATLHSPGQLVIYPIIPLRAYELGVRDYICCLQKTTQKWLELYRIPSSCREEPGVFTETGKLAFIGIRVQNGTTRHGISLNLANNLELFQWIRACGVSQRPLDSLEKHGIVEDPKDAFDKWTSVFISELIKLREDSMRQSLSSIH